MQIARHVIDAVNQRNESEIRDWTGSLSNIEKQNTLFARKITETGTVVVKPS